ncbi:MAG: OmpP1/FadL family transporter [Flavobacteriaceae bacterium]
MKHILLFIGLVTTVGFSQNINDALLFSSVNPQGSARFNAMSGAFGALGGDLSAINSNPAGSAVFKNSLLTGTLMYSGTNNDANYFGTQTNATLSSISINQLGGAFVLNNRKEDSHWKKLVFAINYQQMQDFNQEYFISGRSNISIDSYFLSYANGLAFQDIQALPGEYLEDAYLDIGSNYGYDYQQAFLGYYGGVIDPVDDTDPDNIMYIGTGDYATVNQDYFYNSSGSNSKFNFNVATQYKDVLYLGAALNGHFIDVQRDSRIREREYGASSALEYVVFDNYLYTTGSGFSLQLGAIGKLGKVVRLGASFQSPTWYVITDELSQRIDSNIADVDIGYINENQVNVFEDYNLRTPMKLSTSAAFVFGKRGLLSVDYHYQDFNNIKMKPNNRYQDVNSNIENNLVGTSSIHVGGEYRIAKWSLRAGYRFEESPYKHKTIADDLTGYSLGFGCNFGRVKLDMAYSGSNQDKTHQLYNSGLTTRAKIEERTSNLLVSLTFNF